MSGLVRKLLVLLAIPLLAGCNMVVSERPWFAPEQAAGAAKLRPGVWVSNESSGCSYEPDTAFDKLPDCSDAMMVLADGSYAGLPKPEERDRPGFVRSDPQTWDKVRHLIVPGSPMIDQLDARDALRGDAVAQTSSGKSEGGYLYLAMEPARTDPQGRIVAIRTWLVQCGPVDRKKSPKPRNVESMAAGMVTKRPFKGLKMEDTVCTASSEAALRNAAARSKTLTFGDDNGVTERRWLRDTLD